MQKESLPVPAGPPTWKENPRTFARLSPRTASSRRPASSPLQPRSPLASSLLRPRSPPRCSGRARLPASSPLRPRSPRRGLRLHCLSLHDNAIAGAVPSSLGFLPDLRGLYLFNNRFSGAVPPEFGRCLALQSFDASSSSSSASRTTRSTGGRGCPPLRRRGPDDDYFPESSTDTGSLTEVSGTTTLCSRKANTFAMDGGWWKRVRNTFAKVPEIVRVVHDMRVGGCHEEFRTAREQCRRERERRRAMADSKPGDDVVSCAKATAALRKCMEGKDVLAKHLVAMDDGIREDEWQGWDPYMQAKRAAGYRWWTGMKKCEEEYY
ncbi:hypothetical protein CFC21_100390 [Triticum aestivum]|uniref:Uncharacterized protein n=2 Tax=Triticum aestivum TaxID=4565 RepID=A0A3B6RS81_WHEAT|nr:hypothetical protein CFC21_100390 [Triticum aestivum]